MSKKHYEAIAKILCDSYLDVTGRPDCYDVVDSLVGELVQVFKKDNPRFDKERFIGAVHRCMRG